MINSLKISKNIDFIDYVFLFLILLSCFIWSLNPYPWIADDSFFYLVIAKNIVLNGEQTFSGIIPTNGIHPLWTWILASWTFIINIFDPKYLDNPHYIIILVLLILILSYLFFIKISLYLNISKIYFLIPLCFHLFFGVLGSEAHISFLVILIFTFYFLKTQKNPNYKNLIMLSFFASMTVFARLDNIFFVLFANLFILIFLLKINKLFSITYSIIFTTILLAYFYYNYNYFGGIMPVSGWMKSSFPSLFIKGFNFTSGFNPTFGGVSIFFGWVPIIFTSIILIKFKSSIKYFHFSIFLGVLVKNLYIYMFTRSHTSWYWYSTLDIYLITLSFIIFISNFKFRNFYYEYTLIMLFVIMMIYKSKTVYNEDYRDDYILVKKYTNVNDIVLVSDWPGHLAFFLPDRHIFAADLLTANRKWYNNKGDKNFFDYINNTFKISGYSSYFILWNGNNWLEVKENKIIYNDPRSYPVKKSIGSINISSAPLGFKNDYSLWKIDL